MKKEKLRIAIFAILFIFSNTIFAQNSMTSPTEGLVMDSIAIDSLPLKKGFINRIVNYFEEAKKDKSQSKFDLSFIGGPSYSVDTKLGLGIMASGLYRIDKEDLSLAPSDVAIYTNMTTSGFFSIGVQNTSIFPKNKYRINYDMNFKYMPIKYYGIGYAAGAANKYTDYGEYQLSLKLDGQRQILPNTYIGLIFSAQNIRNKSFKDIELKPTGPESISLIGTGFNLSYDSRDFIPNPSKGLLVQYEQVFYPKITAKNDYFSNIKFTTRAFQQVWHNGLLAFDFNAEANNGDTPWFMLSKIGGPRQMRGYYIGQYRDRKQLNSQVELRQKIQGRHGFVVWAGAGNIFPTLDEFKWDQTLSTYGLGYRWEFKNRVNVRLDYGFGQKQKGFYFNIYESF